MEHNSIVFAALHSLSFFVVFFMRYIPWGAFHQHSVQSTVRAIVRWHSTERYNRCIWPYHNCPIVGMLLHHAIETHLYAVYPIWYAHGFDVVCCIFTFKCQVVLLLMDSYDMHSQFCSCFIGMWRIIQCPNISDLIPMNMRKKDRNKTTCIFCKNRQNIRLIMALIWWL